MMKVLIGATLVVGALLSGCGDPPLCPSDVFVAIQAGPVVSGTGELPQSDIQVRTSIVAGEMVKLEVIDEGGTVIHTVTAAVDDDGLAQFEDVPVTAPRVRLRATASSICGTGVDEVNVDVTHGGDPDGVALEIVAPAGVACGGQISPASDADPGSDGVQILARITSALPGDRTIELTTGSGTTSLAVSDDVAVTLEPGANRLVGVVVGPDNRRDESPACELSFADLAVSFAPPAASGTLNRTHGDVGGDVITLPLCGSVSRADAAVSITIDGGAPLEATVNGTTWCRTISLAEGPPAHTIVALATARASSFGVASVILKVDLTPPPAVGGLVASAPDRRRVQVRWDSPDDAGQPVAGYVLKFASTVLSESNFDTTGTVIPTGAPAAPGTGESAELAPARTGIEHWFAVATFDAAGNRTVTSFGPVTPNFDRTGAIVAPESQGFLSLGFAIAHGKFNDDGFEDLAVSAPTQDGASGARTGAVYVYFGGPAGIAAIPDVTITSTITDGRLGSGLAALRWSSATRDDLAIGAPGIGDGAIFVIRGGATFTTGTRPIDTAELRLTVHPAAPGFFAGSALGSTLVAADVDGDDVDDLVAAAPKGNATGGVLIIYGDTVSGDVVLSDVDASGMNGAIGELFRDPGGLAGSQLGFYLHEVGPTQGASDETDDVIVGYADDYKTMGDSLFVLRGDGTRPASVGISERAFVPGRDVRVDFLSNRAITEWGSQATSIEDQDGDGARELVISAFRFNDGLVMIVSGNVTGTAGVATTTDPGVVLTRINGAGVDKFGAVVLERSGTSPDVDGDGREELFVGGIAGGIASGFVWFGDSIPLGTVTASTASFSITAPASFRFTRQVPQGGAGRASWIGDVTGDGLDDICWTSPFDNSGDGGFEVLTD